MIRSQWDTFVIDGNPIICKSIKSAALTKHKIKFSEWTSEHHTEKLNEDVSFESVEMLIVKQCMSMLAKKIEGIDEVVCC